MQVRMRGFSKYTPLEDSLKIVLSHVRRLRSETVRFYHAPGRVLASDIISRVDVPPFDRAAVDGYAVKASDTFGASELKPIKLRLIGSVGVGSTTELRMHEGESIKIMTGAPMPPGADAVVMAEHVLTKGKEVEMIASLTPGKNVSAKGEDVRAGDVVLKRGQRLRPQDVGMLASTNNLRVRVARKPQVAIFSTGGELRSPGQPLRMGQIADINSYSLAAAVSNCGGVPFRLGIVPDKPRVLRRKLRKTAGYDMVLISGGSSVGEHDVAPDVIEELGSLLVHGVAIRPGGPTAFGVIRGKPVFGLAGFPVATLVAFDMLVRPALRHMQGLPPTRGYSQVRARLGRKISSTLGRADVVRVKLRSEASELVAEPVRVTGSGILSSTTRADGFILVPADLEWLEKNRIVEVELYS